MITSVSRRRKTTLKSDGMFVVPTTPSNLTVALFKNSISIHVERNTLCLVVAVEWSMTTHFLISGEASGRVWPVQSGFLSSARADLGRQDAAAEALAWSRFPRWVLFSPFLTSCPGFICHCRIGRYLETKSNCLQEGFT